MIESWKTRIYTAYTVSESCAVIGEGRPSSKHVLSPRQAASKPTWRQYGRQSKLKETTFGDISFTPLARMGPQIGAL